MDTLFSDGCWRQRNNRCGRRGRSCSFFEDDRYQIRTLNRQAAVALLVHQYLQNRPLTSIQSAGAALGLTLPTVTSALTNLFKLGIVQEVTGRPRNHLFRYSAYLKILEEGTEPLR